MVVFINHCAQFWSPDIFAVTAPIAHSAVIVFFVLSGYVIAYSTLEGDRNTERFVVARLSRLYSVVIPALLLTAILQVVGGRVNPQFYAEHSRGFHILRYVLTACFLQNIWFFSASPPTNLPFWSLSYEFWYYALFGVAVFVRRTASKLCTLIALAILIGPNILLLMPCWLVGVAVFTFRGRLTALVVYKKFVFALSASLLLMAVTLMPPYPHNCSNNCFFYSAAFLSDWVTALAVGFTIISFDELRVPPPQKLLALFTRRCADHTFSLYLYHFPLIAFATAIMPLHKTVVVQGGIATCIVFVIVLLSLCTEAKRSNWRAMFTVGYYGFRRFMSSCYAASG